MAVFIILALYVVAFFLPILAKAIIYFDYVIVLFSVWAFGFGLGTDRGLLSNYDIHTVFVILIYLVAVGIWYGLQQIRVFNIYIFRILACAFSAFILTWLVSDGLLGQNIADGMDTIWMWTIGIVYFVLAVGLRARNSSLIREE